jgi:hypothetical protein
LDVFGDQDRLSLVVRDRLWVSASLRREVDVLEESKDLGVAPAGLDWPLRREDTGYPRRPVTALDAKHSDVELPDFAHDDSVGVAEVARQASDPATVIELPQVPADAAGGGRRVVHGGLPDRRCDHKPGPLGPLRDIGVALPGARTRGDTRRPAER